ncbi:MAG TPA: DUF2268 domain-containing putative Zn-dependent protease [Virgibacillus sp.]|nr:DUF2268 domain-containing putative Zn-dependent protease [Virgibacillus sp.]
MKGNIIFVLVMMLFLAGCQNPSSENDDHTPSSANEANNESSDDAEVNSEENVITITDENDQVFRVISAYKWVSQYVKKAEETDSESERAELWENIVMDHIQDQCLSGEYSHLVRNYVYASPEDLESLKTDADILEDANFEDVAIKALETSAKEFPGPETTVCLLPQGSEMNFLGVNLGAGLISVFYDTSQSEASLQSTIAHEYHHSTWTEKYSDNYEWDLLGSVIFEGKAEYFASLIFDNRAGANFIGAEEEELWDKVKDSLHSANSYKIDNVLYGGENGFPYNYGYFLGYEMVRQYVENHPETTIEEWSKLSPTELYEKSGYGDSF